MSGTVPLFGLGIQGKSAAVSAQSRTNLYYEILKQEDKAKVVAYGTPGLVEFCAINENPAIGEYYPSRGMHWFQAINKILSVHNDKLYIISEDGTFTLAGGTLTVSGLVDSLGPVAIADNGTHAMISTTLASYRYNPTVGATGTVSIIPNTGAGAGLPLSDSIAFLDSFFIVNKRDSGQFYLSASYDELTWNALAFATAESSPDNLIAVAVDRGALALFGAISTELWANSGSLDFPFQKIQGAPVEAGLAARWSLARCGGMWTGLFRNRQGALTFARLNGYAIETISTPDLDYLVNKYQSPADAIGFSYTLGGHEFYQVTFQAEALSWLYDASTGLWSKLSSPGLTRSRAKYSASFGAGTLVSDMDTGKIYKLDPDIYTDAGEFIEREIVGGHVFQNRSLNKLRIGRVRLDMEGGQGATLGQGADPMVMLQISRDGGHTWGNELWTTWGKIGEYAHRAEWRRLGMARDLVFKIRVTDPVKTVIINAVMEFDEASK